MAYIPYSLPIFPRTPYHVHSYKNKAKYHQKDTIITASPQTATTIMAVTTAKTKRPVCSMQSSLATTLFCVLLFTIPGLLLLHTAPASICTTISTTTTSFSGDLWSVEFSWNRLTFSSHFPPPFPLKIAVFTRKWPVGTTPGGMERHAYTLYTALATRGHEIHIFTCPPNEDINSKRNDDNALVFHFHEGTEPGQWMYNKAMEQYEEENKKRPFDVVHTESVALPHYKARNIPNLAVSWPGTEPGIFFRVFLKYNFFYLSPIEQQNVPVMEASDGDNPHDTWSIVVHQTARVTTSNQHT